jgi:hypothetical protein
MSDDLLRMTDALMRAVEDLANARVLLDGALRQLEDRVEACFAAAREEETAARPRARNVVRRPAPEAGREWEGLVVQCPNSTMPVRSGAIVPSTKQLPEGLRP